MSLKTDFYEGVTGLQNQLNLAFQAGVAFVGSGAEEVSYLDFQGITGSALTVGAVPGLYWTLPTAQGGVVYTVWYFVSSEIAPVAPSTTLVQVTVLNSDSAIQVATKTMNVLNALVNSPVAVTQVANVLTIANTIAGALATHVSIGTLPGTASAAVITAGSGPSGSFTQIQTALVYNASLGNTRFTITIPTQFNPNGLRGVNNNYNNNCWPHGMHNNNTSSNSNYNGTGAQWVNSQNNYASISTNNVKNNLLLKSYLAGIQAGLADEQIYSYECNLDLNTSDTITTGIDFNFNFSTT
jgi:hypothetical protein